MPLFHANAWSLPFSAAMCGAKMVLPGPKLDPESLYGLIEQEACTKGTPVGNMRSEHFLRPLWVDIGIGER